MRKLQIGVMGSCADLNYSKKTERLAEQVGYWAAKNNATLVFGAEKDMDSLSTAACRGAKKAGGVTVGVTYGTDKKIIEPNADIVIATGLGRGGGREFSLVLSCDAIITIGGGSGTLTEMAVAYQANIPIIAVDKTGGWSVRLGKGYMDARKRIQVQVARSPRRAVALAIKSIQQKNSLQDILFLTGVHGNEQIGVEVMKKVMRQYPVQWVIANKRAVRKNVRYTAADLNRVAPGNVRSWVYEKRRAAELIKMSRDYRYVIDIHGTLAQTGVFVIVTNPIADNLRLAAALPVKKVVIWPSQNSLATTGPLTRFVECGVEIECGPKNSERVKKQLQQIIEKVAAQGLVVTGRSFLEKEWFIVDKKLYASNAPKIRRPLRDFVKSTVRGETFYPLLVGRYSDVLCYGMKKISSSAVSNKIFMEELGASL